MTEAEIIRDILVFLGSIAVALLTARAQLRRVPSQNRKDDIDVAGQAMKMVSDNMTEMEEVKKRVAMLEDIMNNGKYKISFVTKLGEAPEIKSVMIERI